PSAYTEVRQSKILPLRVRMSGFHSRIPCSILHPVLPALRISGSNARAPAGMYLCIPGRRTLFCLSGSGGIPDSAPDKERRGYCKIFFSIRIPFSPMQPAVSLLLLPEPYVKRTVAFLLFFISDHFPEGFLASYNSDAFPRPRHSRVQKISVQKHLRTGKDRHHHRG